MIRYRLGAVVTEWAGEALWLGVLPDGPIARFDGVGPFVLRILADGTAHSVPEIVETLRGELTGVPDDVEELVAEFLRGLTHQGVVHMINE